MLSLPSAGVHYTSHVTPLRSDGSQAFPLACRSAIITKADPEEPGRAGLCAVNPTGLLFHPLDSGGSVHDDTGGRLGGAWHWPERV